MSQLFHSAGEIMTPQGGVMAGISTLTLMALFLGWVWYAYAPSRREHMEHLANIPFDDGE